MEQHLEDTELRWGARQEAGQHHSSSPGLLRMWSVAQAQRPVALKEVIAIIRPSRWVETKQRVQRLRLPAFTEQRVLGRGRERGLRYLPRHSASTGTGIRYLPKRLISWIVEETNVEPLIRALMEVHRTGQFGDGKIFVLPVEEAIRIRTADRGAAAIQTQQPAELVTGAMSNVEHQSEPLQTPATSLRAMVSERPSTTLGTFVLSLSKDERSESCFDVAQHDPERAKRVEGSNHAAG